MHPIKMLLLLTVLFSSFFIALHSVNGSEMTVIIANPQTKECRVLESDVLDESIPAGWARVAVTKEQCESILPSLKKRDDFEGSVKQYLELLSCEKESTIKSLSYFGLGGKEVCNALGLTYSEKRIVVAQVAQPKATSSFPFGFILVGILIIIFIMLILIKKKRRK